MSITETSEMDEDIQQESVGVQVQLFPPREFPEPDWTDTGPVDQNIPEPVPNAIDIEKRQRRLYHLRPPKGRLDDAEEATTYLLI